ncbi:hypothetical protein Bca52824_080273 [Brassica carinata]|uniref:Uncharacterized protein n=1 Tax=Brassica carinata TaxID=52824 RepID=A0A8X7PGB9_BRACI|nr:hypothetical protein Bca52824_080273 [Brassica carinata]
MRSPVVEGESWENVEETRLTPSSVKALLRKCGGAGVTFLIPTKSQRPWSLRWDSSAIDGDGGEIDVSMSVRTLEELTYTKSMGDGLFSIHMRPNYNVIIDHPSRTANWQRFYFYVKYDVDHPDTASYPEDFVSDARAVVSCFQVSWKHITIERVRRVLDRISKRDWSSDLPPLITGNKRRFWIFSSAEQKIIDEAREMKELPDLGALIKKKLSGAKKASSATLSETTPSETTPPAPLPPAPLPLAVSPEPSVGPVNAESSREDLMRTSERETAEPSVTDGNKKKRSAPDSSALAASQVRTESDGPPKKKKKKEKKKKHVEGQSEPIGDIEGRETATEEGSSRDAATRAVVELNDSPIVLPKRKKTSRSHESSTPAESASAAKTPSAAPPTIVEDLEKRRGEFETARSLQSQAFGTKKCLEALKESGTDIPQEMIDLFAEQEKEYEAEAKRLAVSGIPEELLCLSPLRLRSPFFKENVLAAIDPYGSNAGLIDAGTAAFLQTPSSSQGDHVTEKLDDPTGRELGESSFQERGIASEVVRPEDTTAPLVSDTAVFSAGLVVNEGPVIPTLRASGVTPTPTLGVEETEVEPVNLLDLSDFLTEEVGGEKPDEIEPVLVGNPQGKERAVDEAENPPVLPTDETGGASDQLEAQLRIHLFCQRMRLEVLRISSKLRSSRRAPIVSRTNLICCCCFS